MTPAIEAWLRRVLAEDAFVLRGSVMLRALSGRAREPEDVDHIAIGDAMTLDAIAERIRALAGDAFEVGSIEVLWPDSIAPGIRAMLLHATGPFQVDVALREPMTLAPIRIAIPDVGAMPCAAPEDLFGWKLHGLIEFGLGQWRPKDLYDLDILASDVALDPDAVRTAITAAFATRAAELTSLRDFLDRPDWGESRSNRRRWRRFSEVQPCDELPVIRERVRAVVRALL